MRSVPLVVVVAVAVAGCLEAGDAGIGEPEHDDTTTGTTGGEGPSSTVTGATGSGPGTSDASESGESTGTTGGEASSEGPPSDAPPTAVLVVNGDAAPAPISRAGTLTITVSLGDDRGLARLEVLLDDAPEPLAEVLLAGSTAEVVDVALPIYDDEINGAHTLRAIVHDDADQIGESNALELMIALPEGGSPVWAAASESKYSSKALAVAVDSIGDVIAVGEQAASADGLRSRMLVRKYHAETGEVLWQREVPTQYEAPMVAGNNAARGVAVDAYDNIYVIGEVDPDGDTKPNLWLGKYTAEGLRVATRTSVDATSRGSAVAVDGDGRVFTVGTYRGPNSLDIASVEALDASLEWQWGDGITPIGALKTNAYGVAIDRHGDVVVVGSVHYSQVDVRGLVARYDGEGGRHWVRMPTFPLSTRERLFSVAVTEANEYVAVGRCEAWDDTRRRWLLRMDEDGAELRSEPDVIASCGDLGFDNDTDVCGVAPGPIGRLVYAGVFTSETDDFQIKQTRDDWAIHLWSPFFDGADHATDRGLAVAADADGFVVAAGYRTESGQPRWWVTRRNP